MSDIYNFRFRDFSGHREQSPYERLEDGTLVRLPDEVISQSPQDRRSWVDNYLANNTDYQGILAQRRRDQQEAGRISGAEDTTWFNPVDDNIPGFLGGLSASLQYDLPRLAAHLQNATGIETPLTSWALREGETEEQAIERYNQGIANVVGSNTDWTEWNEIDSIGDFTLWARETLGRSAVPTVAGIVAVPAITALGAGAATAAVGATVVAGATSYPYILGEMLEQNYQSTRGTEGGTDYNLAETASLAIPAAAVEGIADRLVFFGPLRRILSPTNAGELARPITEAVRGFIRGAPTGAMEESIQEGLAMVANPTVTELGPEERRQLVTAAIMGAALEGPVGGVFAGSAELISGIDQRGASAARDTRDVSRSVGEGAELVDRPPSEPVTLEQLDGPLREQVIRQQNEAVNREFQNIINEGLSEQDARAHLENTASVAQRVANAGLPQEFRSAPAQLDLSNASPQQIINTAALSMALERARPDYRTIDFPTYRTTDEALNKTRDFLYEQRDDNGNRFFTLDSLALLPKETTNTIASIFRARQKVNTREAFEGDTDIQAALTGLSQRDAEATQEAQIDLSETLAETTNTILQNYQRDPFNIARYAERDLGQIEQELGSLESSAQELETRAQELRDTLETQRRQKKRTAETRETLSTTEKDLLNNQRQLRRLQKERDKAQKLHDRASEAFERMKPLLDKAGISPSAAVTMPSNVLGARIKRVANEQEFRRVTQDLRNVANELNLIELQSILDTAFDPTVRPMDTDPNVIMAPALSPRENASVEVNTGYRTAVENVFSKVNNKRSNSLLNGVLEDLRTNNPNTKARVLGFLSAVNEVQRKNTNDYAVTKNVVASAVAYGAVTPQELSRIARNRDVVAKKLFPDNPDLQSDFMKYPDEYVAIEVLANALHNDYNGNQPLGLATPIAKGLKTVLDNLGPVNLSEVYSVDTAQVTPTDFINRGVQAFNADQFVKAQEFTFSKEQEEFLKDYPWPTRDLPDRLKDADTQRMTGFAWKMARFMTMRGQGRYDPFSATQFNLFKDRDGLVESVQKFFIQRFQELVPMNNPSEQHRTEEAAHVLAFLRVTGQPLDYRQDGRVYYKNNGGNLVRLSEPGSQRLVELHEALKDVIRFHSMAMQKSVSSMGIRHNGEILGENTETFEQDLSSYIEDTRNAAIEGIEGNDNPDFRFEDLPYLDNVLEAVRNNRGLVESDQAYFPFMRRFSGKNKGAVKYYALDADGNRIPDTRPGATQEFLYIVQPIAVGDKKKVSQKALDENRATAQEFLETHGWKGLFGATSLEQDGGVFYLHERTREAQLATGSIEGLLGSLSGALQEHIQPSKETRDMVLQDMKTAILGSKEGRAKVGELTLFKHQGSEIGGFDTDYLGVLSDYFTSSSFVLANSAYKGSFSSWDRMIENPRDAGVPDVSPERQRELRDDWNYLTGGARDYQWLRSANFMYALGGNVSTAILNLFTLPTTVYGTLLEMNTNPFETMSTLGRNMAFAKDLISEAQSFTAKRGSDIAERSSNLRYSREVIEKVVNKHFAKRLDKTQREALINAIDASSPFLNQTVTEEGIGQTRFVRPSGLKKTQEIKNAFTQVQHLFGYPINFVERLTRLSAYTTSMEFLLKDPDGRRFNRKLESVSNDFVQQDALRRAGDTSTPEGRANAIRILSERLVEESHGDYTQAGRGKLQRGLLGSLVFPFQTYPLTVLELLVNQMTNRGTAGKIAAAQTLAMFVLFAGAGGIPGWEAYKDIYEAIWRKLGLDRSADTDLRDFLRTGMNAPMWVTRFVEGGAPAVAGVDASRRIGIPLPAENFLRFLLDPNSTYNAQSLQGIPGRILSGGAAYWEGEGDLSALVPVAAGNIVRAMSWRTEGVTTRSGTVLANPTDVPEAWQFTRAVGFNPQGVRELQDANRAARLLDNDSPRRRRMGRRLGQLYIARIQASEAGQFDRVREIDQRIVDLRMEYDIWMRQNDIWDSAQFWDGLNRTAMTTMQEFMNPEGEIVRSVTPAGQLPAYRQENIRRAYGLE